jgi:hypothetical protein
METPITWNAVVFILDSRGPCINHMQWWFWFGFGMSDRNPVMSGKNKQGNGGLVINKGIAQDHKYASVKKPENSRAILDMRYIAQPVRTDEILHRNSPFSNMW